MPLKEISNHRVSYLQILDESGVADQELVPDLEEQELVRLYRGMSLARAVDERML